MRDAKPERSIVASPLETNISETMKIAKNYPHTFCTEIKSNHCQYVSASSVTSPRATAHEFEAALVRRLWETVRRTLRHVATSSRPPGTEAGEDIQVSLV